ncbi:MAG TPA: TfoX/Sxy family protein [Stellaceae bacterium]|jgi:DNA transformation protein|nr:TfoX/Sxy family protein [Stellaceae bacterium]
MKSEPEFIRYLRDQFRRWGPVEVRRMFGGHGIFRDGVMFALINDETLYLRSDEATQAAFAAAGMGPFRYRRDGRLVALGYHQAPPEAVEDSDLLGEWADRAFAAALRRASQPPRRAARKRAVAKRKRP